MSVRINSLEEIKRRLNIQTGGSAHAYFTELCFQKMDKFVPMRNGDLATIVDVQTDSITYQSPYASYQYFGVRKDGTRQINEANRDRSKHPLASSYWDRKMISADMNDIVEQVGNYIKIHGGK